MALRKQNILNNPNRLCLERRSPHLATLCPNLCKPKPIFILPFSKQNIGNAILINVGLKGGIRCGGRDAAPILAA